MKREFILFASYLLLVDTVVVIEHDSEGVVCTPFLHDVVVFNEYSVDYLKQRKKENK